MIFSLVWNEGIPPPYRRPHPDALSHPNASRRTLYHIPTGFPGVALLAGVPQARSNAIDRDQHGPLEPLIDFSSGH
ncbi:hypothetical protein Pure05_14700 [Paenarthrobacter ureafaciens]|nr:hypothetical protein Pure01_14700 [Paenarthrobacter ureafaciens]GLU63224.1 hypothetical protein Pure02_14740 [Paenarthrobacter ureafaciens]GLU67499.1 hypothetical protein Pure03_14750 [Paenarthrobacter ureafaciens]GLU71841.1 hypothetical protein Pure04_15560 [Paenarthrobacter ureafaciens]GLU76030.1 hypothetical protein Pure05_14700 [Paenarthrobacter ureafaciens]